MSSYNPQQANANTNRFRFPQQQHQGNIYSRQGLSDSETDVSTSNENLSNEDRYVIRHMARQEPQGQENLQLQVLNSNRNSQRESSSSYNTLIIHSLGEDTWTGRISGAKDSPDSLYNVSHIQPINTNINVGVYDSTSGATKRLSQSSNCSGASIRLFNGAGTQVQEINDIPDDYLNQSLVLKHLAKEASNNRTSSYSPEQDTIDQKQQHYSQLLLYNNSSTSHKTPTQSPQISILSRPSSATNTPHSVYQNKNNLSKSQPDLSRFVTATDTNTTSVVASAATQTTSERDVNTAQLPLQQSHYSAPVLLRNSSNNSSPSSVYGLRYRRDVSMPRPRTRGRDNMFGFGDTMVSGGGNADKMVGGVETTWSADMIDMLLKENSALKLEVENCYARIGKSQKLEQEVLKVHSAHEDLVASCERRERLERTARTKLQLECRRLQDTNRLLRDQLDMQQVQLVTVATAAAATNVGSSSGGAGQGQVSQDGLMMMIGDDGSGGVAIMQEYMRREMNKRDLLIAQFITQNKELGATKERQEIELAAQRATLQEQRTHIDILEAALTNAQGNVVRLEEEECRKKQAYVERVHQLQRTLNSMQIANDRREQTERNLRLQLEIELEQRININQQTNNTNHHHSSNSTGDNNGGATAGKGSAPDQGEEFVADLKRQLREREEKLMLFEGECSKWEQRYLEENALRQTAIDAANISKDAKIAALEKTSEETEKMIAEARAEKIRHMDEAYASQKKLADLESRLKDLESKLAERDAMIRVLNHKHTASYSPHHTPHPSSTTSHHHLVDDLVMNSVMLSAASSTTTGFGSSAVSSSYHHSMGSGGSDSSFAGGAGVGARGGFDVTKKQLESEIKEIDTQLDTQLLTKRALCCFPGFANPIATARKGKLPKPLLASLTAQTKKQNNQPNNNNITADNATDMSAQQQYRESTPSDLYANPSNTSEIMLLEKQGRSSQQQRMSDNVNLPPSSLPRPPPRYQPNSQLNNTTSTNITKPTTNLRYNRLNNADCVDLSLRRKKPLETKHSMIPSPNNRYTRLVSSDTSSSVTGGGSTVSLRKASLSTNGSRSDRDSMLSDNSANSLPAASSSSATGGDSACNKVRFYSGLTGSIGSVGGSRRGSNLGRESKAVDGPGQFRIQF